MLYHFCVFVDLTFLLIHLNIYSLKTLMDTLQLLQNWVLRIEFNSFMVLDQNLLFWQRHQVEYCRMIHRLYQSLAVDSPGDQSSLWIHRINLGHVLTNTNSLRIILVTSYHLNIFVLTKISNYHPIIFY